MQDFSRKLSYNHQVLNFNQVGCVSMNIRSVKLSDYAAISKLLHDVLSEEAYDETIEAFGRQLSWDSDLVMVAEKEEEIVGIIIGTIDNNRAYYYRIVVANAYQRQGIGRQLVSSLKSRFELRNVTKIFIAADEHNEYSLPLFQALGYAATDFLKSPIKRLSIVSG